LKVFILSLIALTLAFEPGQVYSAYRDNAGHFSVQPGKGGISEAVLRDETAANGWFVLDVTTNRSEKDDIQAFAAGFIEGALTVDQIWDAFRNFNLTLSFGVPMKTIVDFVIAQDEWVRTMANNMKDIDQYWAQVHLTVTQFDGIIVGYHKYAKADQKLQYIDFLLYQLESELGDIAQHFSTEEREPAIGAHCSVLVKLSKDGNRLYSSHDTWSSFNSMLRIYKFYRLHYSLPSNKAPTVAFSSYPSSLPSGDDFYITDQNLVVMETTNDIFNQTLYNNFITPNTVPFWVRVVVANRMASNGKEWSDIFAQYNSGTYNNQYQIIDYKLFTPGQPLKPNTLWIAEQIPGFVVAEDLTSWLAKNGYWASYNIPYFPFIYNISGYPALYKQYGNEFSWSQCARAQIFRRDQGAVQDMDGMKKIMRYNEYQSDPLSLKDACRGISARCDLNTPWSENTLNSMTAFGGIDSKITDNLLVPKLVSTSVTGPTWDSQPPFAWTRQWSTVPKFGLPIIYAFDFVQMSPVLW